MQIVIDIPESIIEHIKDGSFGARPNDRYTLVTAVMDGTPLPKGHGDLIDRNELLKHYDNTTYHNGIEERKIHFVQIGYINDAPTIIEAEKGENGFVVSCEEYERVKEDWPE